MEEKKPDIKIDIKVTITDDETGEVIVPKEDPVSPFYKIPWGWIHIAFIAVFALYVKYGKMVFGRPICDTVVQILFLGSLTSLIFFFWKLFDKDSREGGRKGCGYSCLGS